MLLEERSRRALALALPIIGGMLSQNVLNLVDTLMVGRLGNAALAAVGVGGFANFMCVALIGGLSASVQAMSARRFGEGKKDETALPLNGGLLVAFTVGLPLGLLLVPLVPKLYPYLVEQPDVARVGAPYLQARLCALAAVGMNFSFRGYWNGISQSHVYFRTLVVMHAINIVLNYGLIFGKLGFPELGAFGAGVASAIATTLGSASYFAQGLLRARSAGFLRAFPKRDTLRTIIRVSLPASVQQFLFATGLTAFFAIIGRVGTAELAASNVLVNLLLVALLPGLGFGFAAATLVGQALGARDPKDAKRWGWEVSRLCLGVVAIITLPALVFPRLMLGVFLHDPTTVEMATTPLRMLAVLLPLDAAGLVFFQALNGAGDTRTVLLIAASLQWFLLLPAVYVLGPLLGMSLVSIWVAYCAYRLLHAGIFTLVWQRGNWANVAL